MAPDRDFWRSRRVLLTGHTGFKGAWAARWLTQLGATVTGLALPPDGEPNLHDLLATPLEQSHIADLRDRAAVDRVVAECRPNIVIHMAAQALVPESFRDPVGTFEINVLGTVHLLEALRRADDLQAAIIVTTDKVYANDESGRAFVETDPLGGDDAYAASKAAAEMATHAYVRSFFRNGPAIATLRAGNVIGGGDWAAGRLVPDIVRAARAGKRVELRQPDATRPWQHVLDPLAGYLLYAQALANRPHVPASLNFGPSETGSLRVRDIADDLTRALGAPGWRHAPAPDIMEKGTLTLDARLAKESLGWVPKLDIAAALAWTVEWYKAWFEGADVAALTDEQIRRFEALR